jgi:hypothetical protein
MSLFIVCRRSFCSNLGPTVNNTNSNLAAFRYLTSSSSRSAAKTPMLFSSTNNHKLLSLMVVRRVGSKSSSRGNEEGRLNWAKDLVKRTLRVAGSLAPKRMVTTAATQTAVGSSSAVVQVTDKIVGRWLAGCAGMCFGAVMLGKLYFNKLQLRRGCWYT